MLVSAVIRNINMRDTEKLSNRGSSKSRNLKKHAESNADSSGQKAISTKSHRKRHKLKSKSQKLRGHTKARGRTVTGSSTKDSANLKLISRQNVNKNDRSSSLVQSSTKIVGGKLHLNSKKEEKDDDGEEKVQKIKRRRKKKRQRDNVDLDDASRLRRRTRYLLIKIKLEQNLIDAYSGEGWKGQSREKIRPEKELQRARKEILKCKLSIRDAIHHLDSLGSVGSIEGSVVASDGSVYHEHIFCANCKLREAFPDNDIILCDGTCNRAFHQKCLDPPLDTENIPPGDQGWFCKFCECKIDILESTNAHLGTRFSLDSSWQDVFKEEAAIPDGDTALLNPEEEWPSDDPEDDDYDPERKEGGHSINTEGNDDNTSNESSSSSSMWSFDGDCSQLDEGLGLEYYPGNGGIVSDESGEIACGRRQRTAVDYRKLYDEMFGKDAPPCEQVSEDEDWGPGKRRRREKESDAVNTLMTLHESENKYPHNSNNNESNDRIREGSSGIPIKRPIFRIPHDAVEKLRQVFAENELPSRSVKEDLSKELGIDAAKVSKWFKNARYMALKMRKYQPEGGQVLQHCTSKATKDSISQNEQKDELSKSKVSKITMISSQKNDKNVTNKEKMKSPSSPLKKRRQEIPPPLRDKGDKDSLNLSDDVSLRKLLKEKKKKVTFTFEGGYEEAELEFERLSKLKSKVDRMKQKLSEVQNYRAKGSDEQYSNEPCIMYVPIAELREKVK